MQVRVGPVLKAVTTTGTSVPAGPVTAGKKTWQATLTGTGVIAATVEIRASNDGANPHIVAQLLLNGTDSTTLTAVTDEPWGYWDVNVTAISGTGATLTVTCGEVP